MTNEQKCYHIFDTQIKNSFRNAPDVKPLESWVVLMNGRRVAMNSRKHIWHRYGHAKNALMYHLKTNFNLSHTDKCKMDWYSLEDKTIRDWIDNNTEIITLEEYKRRKNQ